MPVIDVILEEGFVSDYETDEIIHIDDTGAAICITALEHGMTSGKASVGIAIPLPDGKVVLAQSSLELFMGAAAVLGAKFDGVECNRVHNQIRKLLRWFSGRCGDYIENESYQTLLVEFANVLFGIVTGDTTMKLETVEEVVDFMNDES